MTVPSDFRQSGTCGSLRKHVEQATHGDPPDQACLNGPRAKWEGYLLGVEEAIQAADGWVDDQITAARNEERQRIIERLLRVASVIGSGNVSRTAVTLEKMATVLVAERHER